MICTKSTLKTYTCNDTKTFPPMTFTPLYREMTFHPIKVG